MANKYIDADVNTAKESYTRADGSALTLTNSVRILYDDTLEKGELFTVITRIRDELLNGGLA